MTKPAKTGEDSRASSHNKILIDDQKFKQSILTVLADSEMIRIINSTIVQSKSSNEIMEETDIPPTTAYRKTKWMVENGLLLVEKIRISNAGKKINLLKSAFKSIDARYEDERVTVEVQQNIDAMKKIAQSVFSIDSQ